MVLILMLRANPGASRNSLRLEYFLEADSEKLNQTPAVSLCLRVTFSEKAAFWRFPITLRRGWAF
jgi:hypothetical protein